MFRILNVVQYEDTKETTALSKSNSSLTSILTLSQKIKNLYVFLRSVYALIGYNTNAPKAYVSHPSSGGQGCNTTIWSDSWKSACSPIFRNYLNCVRETFLKPQTKPHSSRYTRSCDRNIFTLQVWAEYRY